MDSILVTSRQTRMIGLEETLMSKMRHILLNMAKKDISNQIDLLNLTSQIEEIFNLIPKPKIIDVQKEKAAEFLFSSLVMGTIIKCNLDNMDVDEVLLWQIKSIRAIVRECTAI